RAAAEAKLSGMPPRRRRAARSVSASVWNPVMPYPYPLCGPTRRAGGHERRNSRPPGRYHTVARLGPYDLGGLQAVDMAGRAAEHRVPPGRVEAGFGEHRFGERDDLLVRRGERAHR